jgi:hypothetical protein
MRMPSPPARSLVTRLRGVFARGRGAAQKAKGKRTKRQNALRRAFQWAREGTREVFSRRILLLTWDVGGMVGVLARGSGAAWRFSGAVSSGKVDFAAALEEVLAQLAKEGGKAPRACLMASRLVVPARLDLPVNPERPRSAAQMHAMTQDEMETPLAEFAALWNIGAVLYTRGLLTAEGRGRVALEQAERREQARTEKSGGFFGQCALSIDLVAAHELEESLRWQSRLQTPESRLACAWSGYAAAGEGEAPVWLGAAVGLSAWKEWKAALTKKKIRFLGALPLALSVSESPENADGVTLEIHCEDVVAVLRQQGRIIAARSEGRMERPLEAEWLARLIGDWRSGSRKLSLLCVSPADTKALRALEDDLARHWGNAPAPLSAETVQAALSQYLVARSRRADKTGDIPLIRFEQPQKPLVKRAGFWHVLLPILVAAALSGVEYRQRQQIRAVERNYDLKEFDSKQKMTLAQQESQVYQRQREANQNLRNKRAQLARLIPELERLQAIEGMIARLPRLLRALSANISEGVVLESVKNTQSGGGDIGRVQVIGWSGDYGGAQAFALEMQRAASIGGLDYAVAQTDVTAKAGRNGQPGYQVSFWLLPATEEELAPAEEAAIAAEKKKEEKQGGAS